MRERRLDLDVKRARRSCRAAAGLLVAGLLVFWCGTAYAAGKPSVMGLTAAPNPAPSGAKVTFMASVSEATECTLSVTPAVSGLPVSFNCEAVKVGAEVVMPQNAGTKAAKYKFTLVATGPGGTGTAHVTVKVNPAEPNPIFSKAFRYLNACGGKGNTGPVISGDGTSAVLGDCVYGFGGETWTPVAMLPEKGEPLGMSRDGLTLVMHYAAGIEVFGRASEGEEWALQETLPETSSYKFAPTVAFSADGDTLLVLPRFSGEKIPLREFDRSEGVWSEGEAPPVGGQNCGGVALSADGDDALLGCSTGGEGYVQTFVRSGPGWAAQGPAFKGTGAGEFFGISLALSASGETAVVGNPYANNGFGEAWILHRSDEAWSEQSLPITKPEKKSSKLLGYGVAISADGNLALIGAPGVTAVRRSEGHEPPVKNGAVYVYQRSGESWSVDQALKPTERSDEFGTSMALSETGPNLLVKRYSGMNSYVG